MNNNIQLDLKKFPIFEHLNNDELKDISFYLKQQTLKKNEYIFRTDDELQSIYFLVEGKVKIYKISNQAKIQIVNIYSSGDIFPHIGHFFNSRKYPANALVEENTLLFYLPVNRIETFLLKHPIVCLNLLRITGDKLTDFQNRLEEKLVNTTYEQVIKQLLRLSNKYGVTLSNKNVLLLERFHNTEIANMLGATRETISRIMNSLYEKNLIERDKEGRLIIRKEALKAEISNED
ncbi:CRP/FNR family transcriptional regulator [Cytobacillus eiseniae]|uniref:CRP/FNR family transcriptional regulator n=1 Tax=Cytobacillus eiseniae TaxID=762947 RepID=A0ABS4RGG9_9BACI|nr:Crp/Fnr family transcriptional regulator [Cytobacillus eiseniae]MBP2241511.1 CRP/FNR family transcriptional regulator [Cytobacillus eiseniae]